MSTSDYEGAEGIIGRKMVFCPRLNSLKPDELIMTYPDCSGFYLYCCQCSMKHYPNYETMKPCHHFSLVFTDGACPNNGQPGAKAGVGMAYGEHSIAHLAHPVTENLDPKQKRTSQRAELLAAIYGLRLRVAVYEANNLDTEHQSKNPKPNQKASLKSEDQKEKWVIATDSVYVVKGMTEWLPAWKKNNLRTNRNTKPANLDLFLQLDAELATQEAERDVKIGFWHVPREYNTIADRLAKEASQLGDPAGEHGAATR